jgi:methylase of polypeptide subunit release factors
VAATPPPGTYDAAMLMRFVQVLGAEENRRVVRNVAASLAPGGTLYICGAVVDDSRTAPPMSVLADLLFLNVYDRGRKFDLIVSNPPFVPGPARVDYVYRDSGQAGDDALAALVRALPAHLEPGGVAQLLGSWLHVRGEDWPDRVRSWLPGGVDAWIVQREVTDPALHVGTWQRDAGLDLHSPAARAQAGAWLDWLAAQKVEAVGFGLLTLRRIDPSRADATPTVVVEDLPDELTDPLGPEVAGWLDRVAWLRAHARDDALLGARLRLADGVVLERWATAGGPMAGDDGWVEAGAVVARAEGRVAARGGRAGRPHCSQAAGARCRCVRWWSCSRSPTTGRSMRWSPQPCPPCASWCGTACWCRSDEGRRRPDRPGRGARRGRDHRRDRPRPAGAARRPP